MATTPDLTRPRGLSPRPPGLAPGATRPRIVTLPGVFTPCSDAYLLADVARERGLTRDARVLDVFTGSGVLAVSAALDDARHVTAVDVSRRAVATVRANAWLNGVRVRALRGDLLAPVAGERFDLILANPPYLPGDGVPARGASRAWEGGHDGRVLVDRLCDAAAAHLSETGRLLIVQSSLTGERETLAQLAAAGLQARVVRRRRGPLGPLARARMETLIAQGRLSGPHDDEELQVIEATLPQAAPAADDDAAATRVTPYRDGPYLLRGDFELVDQDGVAIPCARRTVALCRCGRSQIRPFCDGTHKLIGFRADSGPEQGRER